MKIKTIKSILCMGLMLISGMSWGSNLTSHVKVQEFINGVELGEEMDAVSFLKRDRKGVFGKMDISGLTPGHVYTVWAATFSKPRHCIDPCQCFVFDLGNPDVGGGVFWAGSGRVVDEYGQASFAISLKYGELPDGDNQVLIPTPIKFRSQTHFALRDHGPVSMDPEIRNLQLTTHGGNCDDYACSDTAIAIHPAPFCRAK